MKNLKLEQALAALYKKYESEKELNDEKVKRLNEKITLIPKIEEKDKQIQDLNDTLKKKEFEIEDLKFKVDEASESTNMIEEMTNQLMEKDDNIIEMRRELTALKRNQETDQELQEEQDEFIKLLERDISDRDYKIVSLGQTIRDHLNTIEEKDKQYNKLKEKLRSLNNELAMFKEQDTDTQKLNAIKRIDELLAKQHDITTEYTTVYKDYIGALAQFLKVKAELTKYTVMIGALPEDFLKKLHLDPLGKYIQTLTIRERASVLVNELLGKFLKRNENPSEMRDLLIWIFSLIKLLLQLVFNCSIIERVFIKLEFQADSTKYEQFSKNTLFNQLFALNSFVEQIFTHLKEETLTQKISQDTFKMVVNKFQEICESVAESENISIIELQKDSLIALEAFIPVFETASKNDINISKLCDPFKRCHEFFQSLIKRILILLLFIFKINRINIRKPWRIWN